jgi:hypothetical protein
MKKVVTTFGALLIVSFTSFCYGQNLPLIDTADNSFGLWMSRDDNTPLIFGFESPDTKSQKVICFSSSTSDVEGNPHICKLGAYYETNDLNIEYVGMEGNFVKLIFKTEGSTDVIFYMEKKNVTIQ